MSSSEPDNRGCRAVCFDWDGCLADTLPLWMELYKRALARRGIVTVLYLPDKNLRYYERDRLSAFGPDFTIGDFRELPAILGRIAP